MYNYPEEIKIKIRDPFMGGDKLLNIRMANSNACFVITSEDNKNELSISYCDIKPLFELLKLYIKNNTI